MGLMFRIKSVGLIEDIPLVEHENSTQTLSEFHDAVEAGYSQTSYNCWIAAGMYVVTFLFSLQQFIQNMRSRNNDP